MKTDGPALVADCHSGFRFSVFPEVGMRTESQHKKGRGEPKNHPKGHFAARKRNQSTENVFCLADTWPSFLLDKNDFGIDFWSSRLIYLDQAKDDLATCLMSDLRLTPSLLTMLERIERHSGSLLMLAVTASGGQHGKLNKPAEPSHERHDSALP
jgi:hypothetical protein